MVSTCYPSCYQVITNKKACYTQLISIQGVSVTYNGEEIGMLNTDISWEDTVDPAGINCGEDHFSVKDYIVCFIIRHHNYVGHKLL